MILLSLCLRRCGMELLFALLIAVIVVTSPGGLIIWCGLSGLPAAQSLICICLSFILTLNAAKSWWSANLWRYNIGLYKICLTRNQYGNLQVAASGILFLLSLLFYQAVIGIYIALMFLAICLWARWQIAKVWYLIFAAIITGLIAITVYIFLYNAMNGNQLDGLFLHNFGSVDPISKITFLWTTLAPFFLKLWFIKLPIIVISIVFVIQFLIIIITMIMHRLSYITNTNNIFNTIVIAIIMISIPYLSAFSALGIPGQLLYRTSLGIVLLGLIIWYFWVRGVFMRWYRGDFKLCRFGVESYLSGIGRSFWTGTILAIAGIGFWFNELYITRYPEMEVSYIQRVIMKANDDHKNITKSYIYLKNAPPRRNPALMNDELIFLSTYRTDFTMNEAVNVIFDRLSLTRPLTTITVPKGPSDYDDGFVIDMNLMSDVPWEP